MQFNSLLAYDKACSAERKIEQELQSTEAGRRYVSLRTRLLELTSLKKQLDEKLIKLNDDYAKAEAEFAACFEDYKLEEDDFAGRKDDLDVTEEEFAEGRKELFSIKDRLRKLRDRLEAISKEADETAQKAVEVNKEGVEKKKQYDEARKLSRVERAARQTEIDRLNEQKTRLVRTIERDLLDRYNRVRELYPDPISHVKSGMCSGCNMRLANSLMTRINAGELTICENCGRLIINV